MRPSAFPVIAALTQIKQQVLMPLTLAAAVGGANGADWSQHSLVPPAELRTNPDFVQWIRKYNSMSVAQHTRTTRPRSALCMTAI